MNPTSGVELLHFPAFLTHSNMPGRVGDSQETILISTTIIWAATEVNVVVEEEKCTPPGLCISLPLGCFFRQYKCTVSVKGLKDW